MGLIRITLINMKRYLKNPLIVLMSCILPAVMIIGISKASDSSSSNKTIGIIDSDKSEYSEELVKSLSDDYKVLTLNGEAEENFNSLKNSDIGALYVIGDKFEDNIKDKIQPKIKAYKIQNETGSIIAEVKIEDFIKEKFENNLESGLGDKSISTKIEKIENEDNTEFNMITLMTCYFMLIGGSIIAQDIVKLKVWKVLKRTIVTPNSDKKILGGMFLATFIIQSVLSSVAFVVASKVTSLPTQNLMLAIWVITLSSLITTSLVIATTRWTKKPEIANLIIITLGILSFFIAIFNMNLIDFSNVPPVIKRLAVISPFYWFVEILNSTNIIKATTVIVLISIVFFTCGSFRLRDFVKED
ncbi:ABC transporter permease [Clostridium sp. SHJSY1]|uniref:ABC transporter permease n=1 Tax=Clostridium sp. SHJSY1 TaxID=2942483 RepID=UPI002876B6DE|nr:ABC transporter permease [Clostridium sp. SHJSY1]MDS0526997.1 ABC transporter permease [Clostridium sp. SHJSY1]